MTDTAEPITEEQARAQRVAQHLNAATTLVAGLDPEARASVLLAKLDAVSAELAEVPDMYDRRTALYLALRRDNVPYATIAEHTDASAEAVRVAINKANNPGRPSRPRK